MESRVRQSCLLRDLALVYPEVCMACAQRLAPAAAALGPGAVAPDFSLSLLEGSAKPDFVKPDGAGKVSLSAHKDKKRVVLIFGSYT